MHVALNAWFWNRPDTGSGQYVRHLVRALAGVAPHLTLTLIAPRGWSIEPPEGVHVRYVPLRGSGHRHKVRFEQQAVPRAAAQAGADLLHVPYWGAPLRSPVPVAVTIHDLIPLVLPAYRGGVLARLYTGLVAASAHGAAVIIADSEATRADILQRLALPPEQVHVVPLAAGEQYRPDSDEETGSGVRRKYGLPDEYVLYLGGYDVRKNIGTLLKAFTYVREGRDIPLVLAGRLPETITPRFDDVPALIEAMRLGEAVRLIGPVEEADKPAIYRMASCFVFPSRYEGFGLPVLEAMACGTPVVTTSASSLPEVAGEAGFTVDPDDARGMAGAILAILTQEDLAASLRERGLRHAAQFSWERAARQTLALYEQTLAGC